MTGQAALSTALLSNTKEASYRRSRWTREGSDPIALSERDLQIFSILNRYRYLRADYIHAFVGGSPKKLIERLGKMQRAPNFYLRRPEQQRAYANANYRYMIYELDRRGRDALGYYEGGSAYGRDGRALFAHTVMVCDILASIELAAREQGLGFISCGEILARSPERTRAAKHPLHIPTTIALKLNGKTEKVSKQLVPDALFGIRLVKGHRFFALEADRSTEPGMRSTLQKTSYLRKMLQYQNIIEAQTYKTHLGLPNLMILNVTNTVTNLQKMQKLFEKHVGGKRYMLFKTHPTLSDFAPAPRPDGRMFTEAWGRVGHDPFCLSQP